MKVPPDAAITSPEVKGETPLSPLTMPKSTPSGVEVLKMMPSLITVPTDRRDLEIEMPSEVASKNLCSNKARSTGSVEALPLNPSASPAKSAWVERTTSRSRSVIRGLEGLGCCGG